MRARSHRWWRWPFLLATACCTAARAQPAQFTLDTDVSAGALVQGTFWFAGAAWHPLVEASLIASSLDTVPLAVVIGMRAAPDAKLPVPVEGFARLQLIGRVSARSEPTLGLELALTGLARPDKPGTGMPAGVSSLEAAATSHWCVALVAAPLRLRFGDFRLTFAEIHMGVTAGGGDVVVFRAGLFRLEYRL